ncbi:dTDP-4-dehydrorhamnose 3,5-epimerase [candidate division GN15 bacterium]|uniref:dTDP-4-dehydrorhamnose 3,5-epimerase n=1 Tax=candidate division GN15 bacterium TaxID=2072418 RepID=A0A855X2J8_9BACT|nr:MAG: dTDP-4-dehydrorhamnose 3,5-epimerase [candidate division GN15 bacterium]
MNCEIDGVIIRELKRFHDSRGWLAELFRHDELPNEYFPVMSYLSMTRAGVTRGPHEHADQADYFCFIGPSTFRLYLWDNRRTSATFGRTCHFDFGEDNPAAVIVPEGVVHAYKNIGGRDGIVFNAPNRLYAGQGKKEPVDEIRHESDPNSPFKIAE